MTSAHSGIELSSTSALGIGTSTAISSAVMVTFSHLADVVCLRPVSPFTQYASGSADRTGCLATLVESRALRARLRTTDLSGVALMISETCWSGMGTLARVICSFRMSVTGTSYGFKCGRVSDDRE